MTTTWPNTVPDLPRLPCPEQLKHTAEALRQRTDYLKESLPPAPSEDTAVRVDQVQAFDNSQQAQGRANINAASADEVSMLTASVSALTAEVSTLAADIGDTDTDFLAAFNAALA